MRFSFALAAALPILARFTSTFAAPVSYDSDDLSYRSVDDLDVRDTLVDLASDFSLRDVHDYLDAVLEARAKGAPYAAKEKKKVTPAAQKARKDTVRNQVATNQAANAAKKKDLIAKQATEPRYGKPRSAGKQKPNVPGYRAAGRAAGRRLPKQPKTPKPQAKKGDRPNAKAQAKQAAANKARKDRATANGAKFAAAKAEMGKTSNLPGRKQKFTANGETVTGKDARTAIFNSHHFDGNKGDKAAPKPFANREQGPAGSKTRPLPGMTGAGKEFPVVKKAGGYQGGGGVGTMRAITQTDASGNHRFQGVVAHDASRPPTHPGYNDHMQVTPHA